ncbi:hypothetical protein [Pseudomonas mangrovi]|uniref:Uncharacterized protein n=1 Tax=Pseudomonas mangrovi TaxID=2161748 RepID=A0A2T5P7P1_9PSED|nr:hypothetical protein [Pseudomonas mangrovi]PTU73760.1 hypothetical protein DBO85_15770 [Pseudomonas mangrovi]
MRKTTTAAVLGLLLALGCAPAQADELRQRLCELYRERLKSYQLDGVWRQDPATGRREKMDAREARAVIEDARESVKIFCNEQGVVR